MALRRILIANRGEIAVRIIRTCRKLNIETVLAASKADLDSVPARLADRTVCIGPARPAESYLKVDTIVHAALATQADAIRIPCTELKIDKSFVKGVHQREPLKARDISRADGKG